MTQSQLKREAFRKQIRQRQINEVFQNARRKFLQRQKHGFGRVDQDMGKQGLSVVTQFIAKTLINHHSRDYQSMMSDISYMNKQITTKPALFSFCLNQYLKLNGSKLIDFSKSDITKTRIDRVSMEMYLESFQKTKTRIQQQIGQMPILIVAQLMRLSKQIQYMNFSFQSAIIMLKFIWNAVQENFHLPKQQLPKFRQLHIQILNNVCISLINLLKSPHHSTVKKHLKQLGLSAKLNQLIDVSVNFNLETHFNILTLINLYNSHDSQEVLKHDINGITIISTESTYKQKYTVYCIYFLKNKITLLEELALSTLNQIFQQETYFIDSIKTDFYGTILQLILSKNRNVNFSALQLLSTIVFYSQSSSDELVQKYQILEYIYARLIFQRDTPTDNFTNKSIVKCTNILSDLTLSRNKVIKSTIFVHHIWDLVFESLQQGCKLFPLVNSLRYFFLSFPRKQRNQFLPAFLQSVSNLPLENDLIPEIKQLKQTIIQIFYFSMQFVSDEQHNDLIRLYQQHNLLKYIDRYEMQIKQK